MTSSPLATHPSACNNCPDRSSRVFCSLSQEVRRDFDSIGMRVSLPKGATLFNEDDPCTNAIIICSGQVKLSCASKEGKTHILKIALPGDVLGLSAAISGTNYEVTAETLGPTEVKSIRCDDLLRFLGSHKEAAMHAARALSEEYRSAFVDARRLALSTTAGGKLAMILLNWGRTPECNQPQMRFIMVLSHDELGNLAGVSRETVTRELGKFQKQKLIKVTGASIQILEPVRLAQLAG